MLMQIDSYYAFFVASEYTESISQMHSHARKHTHLHTHKHYLTFSSLRLTFQKSASHPLRNMSHLQEMDRT